MVQFSQTILNAFSSAPDYSQHFTEQVATVAVVLTKTIGIPVRHDSSMNYRASQSLHFCVTMFYPPRSRSTLTIEVRIYLSSKGLLCAFYPLVKRGAHPEECKKTSFILPAKAPPELNATLNGCRSVLQGFGYEEVTPAQFHEIAPNCITELDDFPATVFQCLFAEVT